MVNTSVGPAEVLAKLQVLDVIKKQIKLRIKGFVSTILRGFAHEGIRW